MTASHPAINAADPALTYERELVGPLFRPCAGLLLERTGIGIGSRILDVACGTGIVARLARERVGELGLVVGVDQSPRMLAVARTADPAVDWREGKATSLPVGSTERFDVVLCQHGLQFIDDRAAAAREMHRVLAPGGRVGIAVWRSVADHPFLQALHRAAEQHAGPIVDQRHVFGAPTALRSLLLEANLRQVELHAVSFQARFPDAGAFLQLNTRALLGMSPRFKAADEPEQAEVRMAVLRDSVEVVGRFSDTLGLQFSMACTMATARR